LLAERAPGDAAIGTRLARVAELRDDEATPAAHDAREEASPSAADAPSSWRPAAPPVPNAERAPASPPGPHPAAPPDPARDALLNLIDARLAAIADAARQATSKESAAHAPT
ncbi:FUSC family protein, partial [Burkholderia multivorans]